MREGMLQAPAVSLLPRLYGRIAGFLLTFLCSNLNMISSGNQESWRFEPGTR
jgi:hypothetical protein